MTDSELHPAGEPSPHEWPEYYDAIDGAPRDTLLRALALFQADDQGQFPDAAPPGQPNSQPDRQPSGPPPRKAVDLACGEGRDTAELIRRGWQVLAVDSHPEAIRRVLARPGFADQPRLSVAQADLEHVEIPPVDLVVASFALAFCRPDCFDDLWNRIVAAIRPGGRFCGQFFGDRDTWAPIPGRCHHTHDQVRRLLAPFTIEHFEEAERDGTDALGVPKHWHVFHVVARRHRQSRQGQ